jgi:hypothetical protein
MCTAFETKCSWSLRELAAGWRAPEWLNPGKDGTRWRTLRQTAPKGFAIFGAFPLIMIQIP